MGLVGGVCWWEGGGGEGEFCMTIQTWFVWRELTVLMGGRHVLPTSWSVAAEQKTTGWILKKKNCEARISAQVWWWAILLWASVKWDKLHSFECWKWNQTQNFNQCAFSQPADWKHVGAITVGFPFFLFFFFVPSPPLNFAIVKLSGNKIYLFFCLTVLRRGVHWKYKRRVTQSLRGGVRALHVRGGYPTRKWRWTHLWGSALDATQPEDSVWSEAATGMSMLVRIWNLKSLYKEHDWFYSRSKILTPCIHGVWLVVQKECNSFMCEEFV